jgi:hypothetical protein
VLTAEPLRAAERSSGPKVQIVTLIRTKFPLAEKARQDTSRISCRTSRRKQPSVLDGRGGRVIRPSRESQLPLTAEGAQKYLSDLAASRLV